MKNNISDLIHKKILVKGGYDDVYAGTNYDLGMDRITIPMRDFAEWLSKIPDNVTHIEVVGEIDYDGTCLNSASFQPLEIREETDEEAIKRNNEEDKWQKEKEARMNAQDEKDYLRLKAKFEDS